MVLKVTVQHPQPAAGFIQLLCGHHSPVSGTDLEVQQLRTLHAAGHKRSPTVLGRCAAPFPASPPISAEDAPGAERVSPKQREVSKHPLGQQRCSRLTPGKLAAQAGAPLPRTGDGGSVSVFSLHLPAPAEPCQQAASIKRVLLSHQGSTEPNLTRLSALPGETESAPAVPAAGLRTAGSL